VLEIQILNQLKDTEKPHHLRRSAASVADQITRSVEKLKKHSICDQINKKIKLSNESQDRHEPEKSEAGNKYVFQNMCTPVLMYMNVHLVC